MPLDRSPLPLLAALLLAGCGVAETAVPPVTPAPPPVEAPPLPVEPVPAAEPEREPELSPRQRWDAPFAVESNGRLAPHDARPVVVVRGAEAPVANEPAAALPAAAERPASPEPRLHRVGPGDTLWGIARRYGVTLDALREANRLQGDRVLIGQTLIIPDGGR